MTIFLAILAYFAVSIITCALLCALFSVNKEGE